MKITLPPLHLPCAALLATLSLASAQLGAPRVYGLNDAMNKGLLLRSCQNDLTQIEGISPVKLIAITLPNNVQPEQIGNTALLMTTTNSGRTPVTIYFEDDTYVRLVLESCKTQGANNLVRIVDDRPTPKGASEYVVNTSTQAQLPLASSAHSGNTLNPAQNSAGGIISLPAPVGVTLEGTLTDNGLVLNVRNASTQALLLDTAQLKLLSDSEQLPTGSAVMTLDPGMQTSLTIPLTSAARAGRLSGTWTVSVPALKATFPLTATLR